MLTSRVVEKEAAPQPRKFPRMMRSNVSGIVVLFVEEYKGIVVLECPEGNHKLGYYTTDWEMESFDEVENLAVVLEQ